MTETLTLEADDGAKLTLYHWAPAGPARATLQIAHGMAEHGARYERFAELLAAEGIAVYANDHRGHGPNTATSELGWAGEHEGWRRLVRDLDNINTFIAERHGGCPRGLFGHSMGSFMATAYLAEHSAKFDAAVLSGSNVGGGALVGAGRVVAKLERLRQGPRGRSGLINFLSFGAFNNDFKPARTDFDWLSRDPAEVDKYIADPLCGFRCTNQFWVDFLSGLLELGRVEFLAGIRADLPTYVFAGERDPVSKGGGIAKLVAKLRAAGLREVTERVYPEGRHEMLNDSKRDEVMEEIRVWLCTHLMNSSH